MKYSAIIFTFFVLTLAFQHFSSVASSENDTNYYCTLIQAQNTTDDCKLLACFIGLGSCYSNKTKEMMKDFDEVIEQCDNYVQSEGQALVIGGPMNAEYVAIVLHEDQYA